MPNTQWREAADQLAVLIGRAEGVGKTYVGDEDLKTLAEIIELAAEVTEDEFANEQQKINLWHLNRTAVSIDSRGLPPQERWRVHTLRIRGYLGEGEGTWQRFQNTVDNVLDALEGIPSLTVLRDSGSGDQIDVSPPQLNTIGHSAFSIYSCHSAEITLTLRERRRVSIRTAI